MAFPTLLTPRPLPHKRLLRAHLQHLRHSPQRVEPGQMVSRLHFVDSRVANPPDLKNQIDNLRLLIRGVEDELAAKREHTLVAENVEAWLLNLRERVEEVEEEVEEDSEEGFAKRRELVKLLVEGISVGRDKDGRLRTHIIL